MPTHRISLSATESFSPAAVLESLLPPTILPQRDSQALAISLLLAVVTASARLHDVVRHSHEEAS